jgi:hypothetical protein
MNERMKGGRKAGKKEGIRRTKECKNKWEK